jgi:alkylation response protein AidB-like acyl-CoA dehydrogenase
MSPGASPMLAEVRRIVRSDLAPLTATIDLEGFYPEEILQKIGAAGGFRQHLASQSSAGTCDMAAGIEAMAIAGEECLSTAFMMWCQDACGWYLENSENEELGREVLPKIASGELLGGTALSNPMKFFSGIESLALKGQEVAGGVRVRGKLPWVSNLGAGHFFGAIFQMESEPRREVMALIPCDAEGVRLSQNAHFVALEGTRTFSVAFEDVLIPSSWILADPVGPYLAKIRSGFILMQIGMALGLVQGCIDIMRKTDRTHEHVNRFLPDRPSMFEEQLASLREEVHCLVKTPWERDPGFLRRVFAARLQAGEMSIRSASAAMLHAGARGYLDHAPAQRRLRESYFVAIVTPALKHLRKELAREGGNDG